MNSFRPTLKLGHILYSIILFLAGILRFVRLGEIPLANFEADAALQAAQFTPTASAFFTSTSQVVPQPAYEILTRAIFQMFHADDLHARIIPALAGMLLVATPLLARKKFGWGHSLLMGLLLAISPIFITLSRTASGISLAALGVSVFLMSLLGSENENRLSYNILAGAGLGLALASGPYLFPAALCLSLWMIWTLWKLNVRDRRGHFPLTLQQLTPLLITTGFVAFTLSTGLGWSFEGFSRFFESIAYWIQGWSSGSSYSGMTQSIILLVYTPVLMIMGLFGSWSSLRDRDVLGISAIAFAFVSFVTSLVYPSRQPHDLLWVALPLAFLGSRYLTSFLQQIVEGEISPWSIVLGLILTLLSFMAYIQIAANASQNLPIEIVDAWQTPFVFLTLMIVIMAFFGLGWSWRSARVGVIFALLVVSLTLSVSSLWRLNFSSQVFTVNELWRSEVPSKGLSLLVDTVESTSHSTKGVNEGLRMEIIGEAPSYLLWAMREYQPHSEANLDDSLASPVVLVEGDSSELALQADYIGQTITIGNRWGWVSIVPPDIFKWWVKRTLPTVPEEWLVLIRQDIAFLLKP
jgi:hypothetical protein